MVGERRKGAHFELRSRSRGGSGDRMRKKKGKETSSPASSGCNSPSGCLHGKPIPADVADEKEYVRTYCSNDACSQSPLLHLDCFEKWEQDVMKEMARHLDKRWCFKDLDRRIWSTDNSRGYRYVFSVCQCRCGGHLKKDTFDLPEVAPKAAPKQAAQKSRGLPKLTQGMPSGRKCRIGPQEVSYNLSERRRRQSVTEEYGAWRAPSACDTASSVGDELYIPVGMAPPPARTRKSRARKRVKSEAASLASEGVSEDGSLGEESDDGRNIDEEEDEGGWTTVTRGGMVAGPPQPTRSQSPGRTGAREPLISEAARAVERHQRFAYAEHQCRTLETELGAAEERKTAAEGKFLAARTSQASMGVQAVLETEVAEAAEAVASLRDAYEEAKQQLEAIELKDNQQPTEEPSPNHRPTPVQEAATKTEAESDCAKELMRMRTEAAEKAQKLAKLKADTEKAERQVAEMQASRNTIVQPPTSVRQSLIQQALSKTSSAPCLRPTPAVAFPTPLRTPPDLNALDRLERTRCLQFFPSWLWETSSKYAHLVFQLTEALSELEQQNCCVP